jgi:hypothetical protein
MLLARYRCARQKAVSAFISSALFEREVSTTLGKKLWIQNAYAGASTNFSTQ